MDNYAGQQKNKVVRGLAPYWVESGYYEEVIFSSGRKEKTNANGLFKILK